MQEGAVDELAVDQPILEEIWDGQEKREQLISTVSFLTGWE